MQPQKQIGRRRAQTGSRPPASTVAMSSSGSPDPVRILVVEDEYLVAEQMANALTDAGFAIVGMAATGDEAIAIAAREHPALAIVDIRLAGTMDGIEVALAIFRRYGIRSILATGTYDEGTQARANQASLLGWLPKPFEMTSLLLKVNSAVRSQNLAASPRP